jgi:hypothetical protein
MHELALIEQEEKNRKAKAEADLADLLLEVARRNVSAMAFPNPKGVGN